MQLSGLSCADIITTTYSYFYPAACLDPERLALATNLDVSQKRMYCPHCRQHNTLSQIVIKDKPAFKCKSCKQTCKRPSLLRPKGSSKSVSTRFRHDRSDDIILDGMQAGCVRNALEAAPYYVSAWALWNYTPEYNDTHKLTLIDYIEESIDLNPDIKITKLKRARKIFILLSELLNHTQKNNGRRETRNERLAKLIKVSKSEFSQDRYWGRVLMEFDSVTRAIESEMEAAVYGVL